MVSLVIYIASFVIIIAIIGSVTTFFNHNVREARGSASISSEYHKFHLYMLEYTKNGYDILKLSEANADETFITFLKEGKSDTLLKPKEEKILYFNQTKLCEQVEEFKIESVMADNGKMVLKTYLNIDGTVYTTDYVMEQYEVTPEDIPVAFPEGLEVGTSVRYCPSGTYFWNAEYATSYEEGSTEYANANQQLNSGTEGNFQITEWRVLETNKTTGVVKMVPKEQTKGNVVLHGSQGYNNAVKLLNDACSALYASESVAAKSIAVEDIERVLTESAIEERNNYKQTLKYGERFTSGNGNLINSEGEHTFYKSYPVIYEREHDSIVRMEPEISMGKEINLGLSRQTQLIERKEGGNNGYKVASIGIRPKMTYYYWDSSVFRLKFKNDAAGKSYADVVLPSGSATNCWVASRYVIPDDYSCRFCVRNMGFGNMQGNSMYASNNQGYKAEFALFPIVSLSARHISGDANSGFVVE